MREKINQLANGIFEYHIPEVYVSEGSIDLVAQFGKTCVGSFIISTENDAEIKGVIYSTDKRMCCDREFIGSGSIISYEFKANNMLVGETANGILNIVSNCGEIEIPFNVRIEVPFCLTSLDRVKDLFQFANLAKAHWEEAIRLFKSEEFKRVILYNEKNEKVIYENLVKGKNVNNALEEFLVAINKKIKININTDKTNIKHLVNEINFKDEIIIEKNTWGYTEINISSDSSFIKLEHNKIFTDDFIGNTYHLEYIIDSSKLKQGNHYGRITLSTIYQTVIVDINCVKASDNSEQKDMSRELKKCSKAFSENYLMFRMNKYTLDKYISLTTDTLNFARAYGDGILCDLMKLHLHIVSNEEEQSGKILEELSEKEKELKTKESEVYASYLYLYSLYHKDKGTVEEAVKKIKKLYEKENSNWKLFWFLLYLDDKFESDLSLKYNEIAEQYMLGCRSPIIYYEACVIINEDPSLLHELGKFELQFIFWGAKNNFLEKDVISQVTYLAGRKKYFDRVLYRCLVHMYELTPHKDILTALCGLLIKGNKTGKIYFKWYRLGVELQLRITELYEYYMYSINEEDNIHIDQNVLLYFIYNSHLGDKKKAYLYANIIKNKDNIYPIYRSYLKHIEQFMLKQIDAKNISINLALIYEEMLSKEMINTAIAKGLPSILFKYQLICDNHNIIGALVKHSESADEKYIPLIDGKADIDIYTENASILLVDAFENRYIKSIDYSLIKYINTEDYLNRCFDLNPHSKMLLLNIGERIQNYQRYDEKSIEIRKSIIRLSGITDLYLTGYLKELVFYYYENYNKDILESYLDKINLDLVERDERNRIIEILILLEAEEKVLKALLKYGFEGIGIKKLLKFCSRIIEQNDYTADELIILLSYHIFSEGKYYNEVILKYLVEYYTGVTKDMFKIWKSADEFQLETHKLEERLLAQMLFSNSYINNSIGVFTSYYNYHSNSKICRAYLLFYAHKYLVKDRVIQADLFTYLKEEAKHCETARYAMLKYYSGFSKINEEIKEFIEKNLEICIKEGVIFPFFKLFEDKVRMPYHTADKVYVDYYADDPNTEVTINYTIHNDDSSGVFTTEQMKNLYCGIYVKEFMLFYNESLQYYITEKDNEEVIIAISGDAKLDDKIGGQEEKRYNMINTMLIAREMQDEKTLIDSVKSYSKDSYVVENLFKEL